MITVVSADNAAEANSTATTTATTATTTTTTAASTATATITQMVTTTIVTATTDITGISLTGSHINWPIHPFSGNFNQNYQHSTDQNLQSFSGSTNRDQNYAYSNKQPSSWIRPHVQLQAIPLTVFSEMVSIETYALCDSGSDNTQITQTIAEASGIRDRKSVTVPVSSLYQEHTIETTEFFHGIEAIDSSRPIINLAEFATCTTAFQMTTVPIQMLNSVCKDFGHLVGINFPQTRHNKIGILIGTNSFTATVPIKYTIGAPGTPYGVLTQLE